MRDYISITLHCEGISRLVDMYSFYCEPDVPYTRTELVYRTCAMLHTSFTDINDYIDPILRDELSDVIEHIVDRLSAIDWMPNDIIPVAFAMVESTSDLIVIFEDTL